MKKGRRISFGIGVSLLMLSSSCNKVLDMVEEQQDSRLASKAAQQKYRIKSIFGRTGHDSTTAYFDYNAAGDPVSIRFSQTATGRLNAFFRYTSNGQLRDYYIPYSDTHFEHWWRYVYDHNGRVIQDTLFQMGEIGDDGPLRNQTMLVSDYTYDRYGRVTKTDTRVVVPNSSYRFERSFAYDITGNQYLEFPHVYDTRANLLSTYQPWQLISRDFSVNNPFVADEYNDAGLPVRFHFTDPTRSFLFLHHNIPSGQVVIT